MPLIVKPISAMLVKDKDTFDKSDPYVVILVGNQKQRSRTCQGGGKKPIWTDNLSFNSTDSMMRIQVYDQDTFSRDDLIGDGTLNLTQFYMNPMRTENEYVDLLCQGRSAGRLLLSIEYQGPPMGGGYQGGGNQGGWGNQGGNQGGWGGNQQGGWGGNQGGWGNQGGNQGGWGNQGGNQGGWGNQGGNQGGWGGNQGGYQGGNQGGWGNQGGNQGGWGNQGGNQGGWGNQGGNQGGWGNQGGRGGNFGPNQSGGWNNGW